MYLVVQQESEMYLVVQHKLKMYNGAKPKPKMYNSGLIFTELKRLALKSSSNMNRDGHPTIQDLVTNGICKIRVKPVEVSQVKMPISPVHGNHTKEQA